MSAAHTVVNILHLSAVVLRAEVPDTEVGAASERLLRSTPNLGVVCVHAVLSADIRVLGPAAPVVPAGVRYLKYALLAGNVWELDLHPLQSKPGGHVVHTPVVHLEFGEAGWVGVGGGVVVRAEGEGEEALVVGEYVNLNIDDLAR